MLNFPTESVVRQVHHERVLRQAHHERAIEQAYHNREIEQVHHDRHQVLKGRLMRRERPVGDLQRIQRTAFKLHPRMRFHYVALLAHADFQFGRKTAATQ